MIKNIKLTELIRKRENENKNELSNNKKEKWTRKK